MPAEVQLLSFVLVCSTGGKVSKPRLWNMQSLGPVLGYGHKGRKKGSARSCGVIRRQFASWRNSVLGRHLKSGLKELVSSSISMQFNLSIYISPLKELFKKPNKNP